MIQPTKIKPLFNGIITTAEVYKNDQVLANGIIDSSRCENSIKEFQTVVSIGEAVRSVKVGDLVKINPQRFAIKDFGNNRSEMSKTINPPTITGYRFPILKIKDVEHLMISDRDIEYIVEEFEKIEEPKSKIFIPKKKLIL